MRFQPVHVVAALVLLTTPALGQFFDPTNPEGSPMVGRFAEPVVPLGAGTYGAGRGVAGSRGGLVIPLQAAEDPAVLEEIIDVQLQSSDAALDQDHADPSANSKTKLDPEIMHQPLIQVKVRVVEVQRTDSLIVSSVLDFITAERDGTAPFNESPFSANSLNDAKKRLSGITRFPVPGLVDATGNGAGMLVNLTSGDVNYVAKLLATELNADTITAPQVTTLNGKNTAFRAGSWVPFFLGANLIQGSTNTVQEVFYRHVGTYISVTPQIVNWGDKHENLGRVRADYATVKPEKVALRADDILDVKAAMLLLISKPEFEPLVPAAEQLNWQQVAEAYHTLPDAKTEGAPDSKAEVRERLLNRLNTLIADQGVMRSQLSHWLEKTVAPPQIGPAQLDAGPCEDCNWTPSDCTINVNLGVRLSNLGIANTAASSEGGKLVPAALNAEENVRAISNVVQIKSGHGVVIGGLIAMQDVEAVSKVPFIGDLPVIGAAFRSKQTQRIKTETLIFLEASVLPSFECQDECGRDLVKTETEQDFCNGKVHIQGELCDGPLAYGMHRAGLQGDYLPCPSHGERDYWINYHRTKCHLRHHKLTTRLGDTFE